MDNESLMKMAEDAIRMAQNILDLEDQERMETFLEDQSQHTSEEMERENQTLSIPYKLSREDILKDQGYYETEVDPEGEGDCELHSVFIDCQKNPDHADFIPFKDFKIEHLPAAFRDDDLVQWILCRGDLTTCIQVERISENRPETFPETNNKFPYYNCRGERISLRGTGYVGGVYKYSEIDDKPCQCEECGKIDTAQDRKKVWGKILIVTAAHVVFDERESKETTCYFFYDEKKSCLKTSLMLSGLTVLECYVEQDKCLMTYSTHDLELLELLDKKVERCRHLARTVSYKFIDVRNIDHDGSSGPHDVTDQSRGADPEHNICICISHPHGCAKHVSIGTWTERIILRKGSFQYMNGKKFDGEFTQYSYTTPTCRGSSGALVFSPVRRLVADGTEWAGLHHPHCTGRTGDVSTSGFAWEAF